MARIDKLLLELGLADSQAKARALVMSGVVLANEQRVEKASQQFDVAKTKIRIKGDSPENRFVSRGGLKLEKALKTFQIDVRDFVCLDVGASTGGFTDCLLQNGAQKVVAVDAGHNQIDWKLRTDDRVEVRENVNARNLQIIDFTEKFDLIVMDVSFISVTKIFPAIVQLLKETGKIVTLIKPQFEVAKGEVGTGGIVREPEKHERVINEVHDSATANGLRILRLTESPITGADGNREFLALYERND
ncbi:MAG: TlyA family RNA methyltransferase [Pyrinomonadaceae bacterium]|nr:TlyA family RNA methyltransferase [Pyrinomonadaceae bacterium]